LPSSLPLSLSKKNKLGKLFIHFWNTE